MHEVILELLSTFNLALKRRYKQTESGNNQIDPIFLVLFLKDLLNTLIQLQLFRGSVSHQFPIPNTRRRQIKHFPKPAIHRDNQQLLGSRSHGYPNRLRL